MTKQAMPLTFNAVDGLAFAAAAGRLDGAQLSCEYTPTSLGPLLEFLHLAADGLLPSATVDRWLTSNGAAPMIAALREHREGWLASDARRMGFIKAARSGPEGDGRLTAFLMDAQRAVRDVARLAGSTPGQLAAAMHELENNIHEHSEAAATGLLAFRAAGGVFEFVAADAGIGILASLRRCPLYATLSDHGNALKSALTDGASRFGTDCGRGYGFRPLFLGLANLQGRLRFRSGDHALIIDGTSPTLMTARLAQKPPLGGFFASIRCHAPSRRSRAAVSG